MDTITDRGRDRRRGCRPHPGRSPLKIKVGDAPLEEGHPGVIQEVLDVFPPPGGEVVDDDDVVVLS